ncbi:MFS transporter [Segnochrobactrum spirostomi]|uniref:MFS transporter n=1 Tax=Segnochrobactrum spirostomi TaxID=2608987 RepID=UPI001AD842F4|nr:MFS transporter [Segnochrobactrum spirostomi]
MVRPAPRLPRGLTILFCLSEFWINAAAPADRRGVALGIYGTMLSLGFTLGPVILSVVGTQGFTPFALSTAIMLLTLLPILAGRDHQPLVEGKSAGSILHYLWVAPAATFAALVFGAVDSGILSLLPVYGIGVGLSVSTSTFLISALGLGLCVAQIPIGFLADRMDKRLLLFLLTLGSLAVAVAIPFANGDPTALWIGLFCWGALITGLYTVGLALLGARFSGASLASANAAFILLYAVGMLIGPSTMGFGLDTFGPNGIFHVAAGFLTLYAIITVLRLRRDG